MLTCNEVGYIVHRSRTIQGIHGYKILERRWLKLTQIFLHTCRFKLESTDSAPLAIKLICLWVVDVDIVYIYIYTSRLLDI